MLGFKRNRLSKKDKIIKITHNQGKVIIKQNGDKKPIDDVLQDIKSIVEKILEEIRKDKQ